MSNPSVGLGQQLCLLEEQLQELSQRVAQLEQRGVIETTVTAPEPTVKPSLKEDGLPNETMLLVGSSSLLQHISVLCFLLVAALGLRALTDNDLIGAQLGSFVGMAYAVALLVAGAIFYQKKSSRAPLFTCTGGLLMFSVVVETYTRFAMIPVELVYIMLALTGIAMAVISYRQKATLPIIVGSLGMCLAAVVTDYPNPYFPYLGLLLWLSNILGYFAARLKRCSWMRWVLVLTTHFMLQIWGLKLSGFLSRGESAESLAVDWFIPIVMLLGFSFMMISLFGIIRSGNEKISKFDFSLPAVNAAWCYVAGIYALKDPALFGAPAAAAAVIHFGLAFWLADRQKGNAAGTNTFIAGGIILACLSLPAVMGSMLLPVPILAILAFIVCYYSVKWSSGGVRVTAYLLQGYVSLLIAMELLGSDVDGSVLTIFLTLVCALTAITHYRFCRRNRPPERSEFFRRFDRQDQAALLPLCAGLVNLFFATVGIAYFILQQFYSGDLLTAHMAIQSIMINGAAVTLIFLAAIRQNKELRNTAILVMLIGGGKVFIIDMFRISGTWLVFSIFSFGIAAALESLILARWKDASTLTAEDVGGRVDIDSESETESVG